MGRGAFANALIEATSHETPDRVDAVTSSVTWSLSIVKGPLKSDPDPATRIVLTLAPDEPGKRMEIELDPEAPTLESIFRLGNSGIPLLEILFPKDWNAMVD
jgi:hypothetical protein